MGGRLPAHWVSPLYLQTDLRREKGGKLFAGQARCGASRVVRTEQLDFEPNLRQRLYEIRRLLRRNVPAIPPEHVQPVRPISPARDVRGDRVRERALRRDQRKGQGRRDKWRGGGARRAIRRWCAVRRSDFRDKREVEAVGQVLEPAAHRELGVAVDVMQVLQAVVLYNLQQAER